MRLLSVTGTRPQFIKAAPLHAELVEARRARRRRHRSALRPRALAGLLRGARPGRARRTARASAPGSHAEQTAAMLIGIERAALEREPDAMLVYGDTNSTLAGALAPPSSACRSRTSRPACARSTCACPRRSTASSPTASRALLLCPSETAVANLAAEGIRARRRARRRRDGRPRSRARAGRGGALGVIRRRWGSSRAPTRSQRSTARRTPSSPRSARIVEGLARVEGPVVLPLHPRTRAALAGRRACSPALERAAHGAAAARLPRLHGAAARGARLPDRLGRRAEGGLPALRPLRHAARHDGVGRDRAARLERARQRAGRDRGGRGGPAARGEHPEVYGDGHAAGRMARLVAEIAWRTG